MSALEKLKKKYDGEAEHLKALEDAVMEDLALPDDKRWAVRKAIRIAFDVGNRTMTTDNWIDETC